jgi:hypothetical protein
MLTLEYIFLWNTSVLIYGILLNLDALTMSTCSCFVSVTIQLDCKTQQGAGNRDKMFFDYYCDVLPEGRKIGTDIARQRLR